MKGSGAKNINIESKDGFEHFTKILMEKMDSSLKTVTEQYGSIVKEIKGLAIDVDNLKEDMAIVRPAVEVMGKDVREIKSELNCVKMAVMTVSHETGDHEKRIKKIEEKVFV